jgi:hypothetical protein
MIVEIRVICGQEVFTCWLSPPRGKRWCERGNQGCALLNQKGGRMQEGSADYTDFHRLKRTLCTEKSALICEICGQGDEACVICG